MSKHSSLLLRSHIYIITMTKSARFGPPEHFKTYQQGINIYVDADYILMTTDRFEDSISRPTP